MFLPFALCGETVPVSLLFVPKEGDPMRNVNFSPLSHGAYRFVDENMPPESDPIPPSADTSANQVALHKVSKAEADKLVREIEERKRHAPHNPH